MNRTDFSRFPCLTLLAASAALALAFSPATSSALQLDRAAAGSGAWWQVFTGHFTHWNSNHLAWDLVAFLALGSFVERASRPTFALTLLASALAISVGVLWLAPTLATYRGLSGIDSALFAAVTLILLRRARSARSTLATALPVAALVGFVGKVVFELVTGGALFVAPSAEFVPVPLAHLLGAFAGVLVTSLSFARSPDGGLRPDAQSTPGLGAQIPFPPST